MKDLDELEISIIKEAICPRSDWFGYSVFKDSLCDLLVEVSSNDESGNYPIDVVEVLIKKLESSDTGSFAAATGDKSLGLKGLYGEHPIHAAIYNMCKQNNNSQARICLLAHISSMATTWRQRLKGLHGEAGNEEELALKQYEGSLGRACLGVRRIREETVTELNVRLKTTREICKAVTRHLGKYKHTGDHLDVNYLQHIERFLSYGLEIRSPRGEVSGKARKSTKNPNIIQLQHLDDDPNDNSLPAGAVQFAVMNTVDHQGRDQSDEIRSHGAALSEERAAILLQREASPLQVDLGDSSVQAAMRARNTAAHKQKTAKLLPHRWEQLNEFEIRQLWTTATSKQRYSDAVPALALMLMTGSPLTVILHSRVVKNEDQVPGDIDKGALYFCKESKSWFSHVLTPEQRRTLQTEWLPHMQPSNNRLKLVIPEALLPYIEATMSTATRRVSKRSVELFKARTHQHITDSIDRLISDTNKKNGARVTLLRLENHLFNTINQFGNDTAEACLITETIPNYGHQSPLYYFAPTIGTLESTYLHGIDHISQQAGIAVPRQSDMVMVMPSEERIGSQIVPTDDYVINMVASLKSYLKEATRDWSEKQFIDFHNTYTGYTMMLLMFSTGYRAVRDPLSTITEVNFRRKFVIISDKIDDTQSHSRLVPVPDITCQQLDYYQDHTEFMKTRLASYMDRCWQTTFFFLDQRMRPVEARPKTMERYVAREGSPPLNINRHYLRTRLREFGATGAEVDAFMGHWDHGQEPMQKFSSFSLSHYQQRLASILESLMHHVGWEAIRGIA